MLVAAGFVIAVGFGIVAPALPTFAKSFHVGVTAVSLVISAFAFMRVAFAPVSGRLVAALGERSVYVTGILIVAVSTGTCAFAQTYWQMLGLRAFGGIGSTMFTVSAATLLIRVTPPGMRGRAQGLFSTGFLIGSITGPLVGGSLLVWSVRAPFLIYSVSLVIAAVGAWLFLRRSTVAAQDSASTVAVMTVRDAVRHRAYRAALASNFVNGWAVLGVRVALIPLFVGAVLHSKPGLAGVSLSVFAIGDAAVVFIAGSVADRIGRKPVVLSGLAVSAFGTIWLGSTSSTPWFLTASLIGGIGAGLLGPAQNAVLADVVGKNGRGGPALAAYQMASDLGAIIGPLAAGALADAVSFRFAYGVTGSTMVIALLIWLTAPETLPSRKAN